MCDQNHRCVFAPCSVFSASNHFKKNQRKDQKRLRQEVTLPFCALVNGTSVDASWSPYLGQIGKRTICTHMCFHLPALIFLSHTHSCWSSKFWNSGQGILADLFASDNGVDLDPTGSDKKKNRHENSGRHVVCCTDALHSATLIMTVMKNENFYQPSFANVSKRFDADRYSNFWVLNSRFRKHHSTSNSFSKALEDHMPQ